MALCKVIVKCFIVLLKNRLVLVHPSEQSVTHMSYDNVNNAIEQSDCKFSVVHLKESIGLRLSQ